MIGRVRLSSDLDRGTTLSGVVSVDCGMGGNSGTKLGCVEWSKMGSYAGEYCAVWTKAEGVSSKIAD